MSQIANLRTNNTNPISMEYKKVLDFYKNKSVFITGNTGFKGSWLTHILLSAGAIVHGYGLRPLTTPSLFHIIGLDQLGKGGSLHQFYADVRDLEALKAAFESSSPEIVFHLAAQPIVRDSYRDPVTTYSTNVMGTVNVCECVRTTVDENGQPVVKSFLNITTDKVYKNNEWEWGYRETDFLDGLDPYSNSKSCSELVTHSYKDSFFADDSVAISTARAGNVIGGGDFSNDRIIPDCVRAGLSARQVDEQDKGREKYGVIRVRNPYSTRPYQHVLEPLFAYLLIAKSQYEDRSFSSCYNIGPDDQDNVSTGDLVTLFCDTWNKELSYSSKAVGVKASWVNKSNINALHEAQFLKLDCSKLKHTFHWKSTWHIEDAIRHTVAWTRAWIEDGSPKKVKMEMDREIEEFVNYSR